MKIHDILFQNVSEPTFSGVILKASCVLVPVAILWYIIRLLFAKFLFGRKMLHRDVALHLSWMWSIVAMLACFSIYIGISFRYSPLAPEEMKSPLIFLGFLPEIVIYLMFIICFVAAAMAFKSKQN